MVLHSCSCTFIHRRHTKSSVNNWLDLCMKTRTPLCERHKRYTYIYSCKSVSIPDPSSMSPLLHNSTATEERVCGRRLAASDCKMGTKFCKRLTETSSKRPALEFSLTVVFFTQKLIISLYSIINITYIGACTTNLYSFLHTEVRAKLVVTVPSCYY